MKIENCKIENSQSGFTLIELLVVIAVTASLATVAFLMIGNYNKSNQLKLTAQEIVAALSNTSERSQSQESGNQWGMQFINSSSSAGTYAVFSGPSYASGTIDRVYRLEDDIEFLDPPLNGSKGVIFQPITGSVGSYFSITIAVKGDTSLQKVIEVTPLGRINETDGAMLAVSSVSPSGGANNGPVSNVALAGSGFRSGATVKLTKGGQPDITGSGFQVIDSNDMNNGAFNLSGAATGTWNVVVSNSDGSTSTLANGFTVNVPAPVVTAISPNSVTTGQTVNSVSVSGAYFQSGAAVSLQKLGQAGVSGTGFVFSSSTNLTGGSFNLSGAATGTWNVLVTNPDSQVGTLVNGFTVNAIVSTGTINSAYQYAWNDNAGWLAFASSSSNVVITDSGLTGYAWNANEGNISLSCANDNSCATVNYGVTNTTAGTLAGYAWNDQIGWISFCGGQGTAACPGTVSYGVTIDSSGDFHGYAWNDNIGWISFNCANDSSCGTVAYKVNTTWLSH